MPTASFPVASNIKRELLLPVLARWVLAAVFLLNILPLSLRDPQYRFYLYHGGDQEHFMNMAEDIVDGNPRHYVVGIGQALIMLPFVAIQQPHTYYQLAAPLVIINGFIFAGISVYAIGLLVWYISKNRKLALITSSLWATFPLLIYFGFFWHFDPVIVYSSNVPMFAWLNGLSDAPAMLFFLLGITLLIRIETQGEPPRFWQAAGVGAALSATLIFRFHYLGAIGFLFAFLLLVYGWKATLTSLGGFLIIYLPQGWYNTLVYEFPFTTGYVSNRDIEVWGSICSVPLYDRIQNLPIDLSSISILLNEQLTKRPWLLIPLLILLLVGGYTLRLLQKEQGWRIVILLIGAPLAYIVPISFMWPFRDAVLRFSMPVLPYLIVVFMYASLHIMNKLKGIQREINNGASDPQD